MSGSARAPPSIPPLFGSQRAKLFRNHMNSAGQRLQNVKQSPSRLDPARKSFEGRWREDERFLHSNRPYDMIAICEAPDDKDDRKSACSVKFFPGDRESDILPTAYA